MYAEDELLPISALQHLLFCERQCALIHIERLWAENKLTVEGAHLHENAHFGPDETRASIRISRGLSVRSLRLGISGQTDVVEFHTLNDTTTGTRVVPVEYKRGKPKRDDSDRTQLCAQALCLEEMLGTSIADGALYYATTKHRTDVIFDSALRDLTEQSCARLRELITSGHTPHAKREPKCRSCSLVNLCVPDAMSRHGSAERFTTRLLAQSIANTMTDGDA